MPGLIVILDNICTYEFVAYVMSRSFFQIPTVISKVKKKKLKCSLCLSHTDYLKIDFWVQTFGREMSIFPHFLMMGVRCLFFHSSITSKTNGQNMLSVKEIDKLYSKEIHNVLLVTTTKVFLSFFLHKTF